MFMLVLTQTALSTKNKIDKKCAVGPNGDGDVKIVFAFLAKIVIIHIQPLIVKV